MKTQRTSPLKRGFTLMELMVAMAITTIIVTVLVSITSIALDTWNRSRSELRASRQAKSMIDTMARDFESLVTRRGNTGEWLSAVTDPDLGKIGDKMVSTNASKLIFFTAATDRYDGQIGTSTDLGGDVSCVAYQLEYKDPIDPTGTTKFETFVLSRLLVSPKDTFDKLLGNTDSTNTAKSLDTVFATAYATQLSDPKNFVCENVFQFSVTFHVQVTDATKTPSVFDVPVTVGKTPSGQMTDSFRIQGTGIKAEINGGSVTTAQLASGRVTAIEISATVLSDFGVDQSKSRTFKDAEAKATFFGKNSYQYSKLIQLPSM